MWIIVCVLVGLILGAIAGFVDDGEEPGDDYWPMDDD